MNEKTPESLPSLETFIEKTATILEAAEAKTIETLRPYVAREPKPDQIFACFELYSLQNYGLNYNSFLLQEKNGKKRLQIEPQSWNNTDSLLPELENYWNDLSDNYQEMSEEDLKERTAKQEQQLFDWFSRCWKLAGGENAKTKTYFTFEQAIEMRDMLTGEVFQEEARVAQKLGYDVPDAGYTFIK